MLPRAFVLIFLSHVLILSHGSNKIDVPVFHFWAKGLKIWLCLFTLFHQTSKQNIKCLPVAVLNRFGLKILLQPLLSIKDTKRFHIYGLQQWKFKYYTWKLRNFYSVIWIKLLKSFSDFLNWGMMTYNIILVSV